MIRPSLARACAAVGLTSCVWGLALARCAGAAARATTDTVVPHQRRRGPARRAGARWRAPGDRPDRARFRAVRQRRAAAAGRDEPRRTLPSTSCSRSIPAAASPAACSIGCSPPPTALVDAVEPQDRVALLTFSQVLAIRAPLTTNRDLVRQALAAVRAGGSTSVIDALSSALTLPGAKQPADPRARVQRRRRHGKLARRRRRCSIRRVAATSSSTASVVGSAARSRRASRVGRRRRPGRRRRRASAFSACWPRAPPADGCWTGRAASGSSHAFVEAVRVVQAALRDHLHADRHDSPGMARRSRSA